MISAKFQPPLGPFVSAHTCTLSCDIKLKLSTMHCENKQFAGCAFVNL